MSFVVVCDFPGDPDLHFQQLTAVVGRDARLYWLVRDVVRVLGKPYVYGYFLSRTRVRDVAGETRFPEKLARKTILPHDRVKELFRKSSRRSARAFGWKLESPETRLLAFAEYDVTRLEHPARLFLTQALPTDRRPYFYVWYEFYRKSVMTDLYGLAPDALRTFVRYADPPRPEEGRQLLLKNGSVPDRIVYHFSDRHVTYLPVASR